MSDTEETSMRARATIHIGREGVSRGDRLRVNGSDPMTVIDITERRHTPVEVRLSNGVSVRGLGVLDGQWTVGADSRDLSNAQIDPETVRSVSVV